jgi:hypothetical protein
MENWNFKEILIVFQFPLLGFLLCICQLRCWHA